MESLINLEVLLNEFYHHSTSNFRKKEIETVLREFQDHEQSWQIILQNLTISINNQYLFFFSVSTLEVSYLIIMTILSILKALLSHSEYDNQKMVQTR